MAGEEWIMLQEPLTALVQELDIMTAIDSALAAL
jgi:hypothetical protein